VDGQGTRTDEVVPRQHLEQICLRNLLASTTEAVYFKDRNCRFLLVSKGVVQHHAERQRRLGAPEETGLGPEDLVGKSDLDLFDGPLAEEWIAEEQRIMETGEPTLDVLERETSSGTSDAWFQTSKAPLRDDNGAIIGTFGISRDVTARVNAEQEVARQRAQLRAVLDSSPDAIASYNEELRYEMVNAKAAAMLGRSADRIVGKTDVELGRPSEIVGPLQTALRRVLETKEMCEVEYSTDADANGAGSWWQVRMVPHMALDGAVTGVVTATRDLTELKAAQRVLAHQALHDPLTGAANRLALIDRLSHALDDLERHPGRIALLFIDLDNFKPVNDAFGHEVGDELLVEVASRLARVARRADTVARFGGDEFVVLLDRLSDPEEARLVAARVLRSIREPLVLAGESFRLTASIGVAVASDPWAEAGELLRHADIAMYRAKEKGKDRIEFFRGVPGDHPRRPKWSGPLPPVGSSQQTGPA
jgi:diguanylate cyclase (GGDEF)-like protein/PAS domain S-box-containing protein